MKKSKKKPKNKIEKPKLPWEQEKGEFVKEKFPKQIVPKQEKLIKGWRRT